MTLTLCITYAIQRVFYDYSKIAAWLGEKLSEVAKIENKS